MNRLTFACLLAAATFASLLQAQPTVQEVHAARPPVSAQTNAPANPEAKAAIVRVIDTSATPDDALVSMNFDETPLADVIKAFRDATGANIISSGTNLQGVISVRLDNVPWRKGLGSVLEPQGLQLVEQPINSGIYVVTTKTVSVPLVTQTFSLDNAKAEAVAILFTSTLGKTGTATPFPSANVVIVTATEQQLSECADIVRAIDKPRPQVYIEARFAELSAAASRQLGMKWDSMKGWTVGVTGLKGGMEYNTGKLGTYDLGTKSIVDGTEPADSTYTTYKKTAVEDILVPSSITSADGAGRSANSMSWNRARGIGGQLTASDFSLTLSAFEQLDGVSIFSNPKIIVANEEIATIDMSTKEPNVEVQATRSGTSSDQLDITTKLAIIPGKEEPFVGEAFFSYGISLKVTPRVSSSGLISVQIEPSISDKDTTQGGDSKGKNMGYFVIEGSADTPTAKYPIIKVNRLKTAFSMQSGTTAVIGGLSRTTEKSTDSGIPFLRSLPWVGPRVFGWKNREKEQAEIVIFVTVGLADPTNLKEDVGMPKNAVLSRDMLSGKTKEPGDRTIEEIMNLKDSSPSPAPKAKAATATAEKPAQDAVNAAVEAQK